MGDFLGFTFNGVHSSDLGITRVSDGDRYSESPLPELEDKIITIPGKDGGYYFGSNYTTKTFSISIAFDSMTEAQFRYLIKLFSSKKICPLVFDERPYKTYMVKTAVSPQLNYICFDEDEKIPSPTEYDGVRVAQRTTLERTYIDEITGEETTVTETQITREKVSPYIYTGKKQRIYKGEGSLEFITVRPYAIAPYKKLEDYGDFNFVNRIGFINTECVNNPRTIAEAQERAAAEEGDINDAKYQVTPYKQRNENVNEWGASSGILPYEQILTYNIDIAQACDIIGYNSQINLYNAGDVETPFFLLLPYKTEETKGTLSGVNGEDIVINKNNNIMILEPFTAKVDLTTENGIIINTHNHLIEGVRYTAVQDFNDELVISWQTTGNLYNEHIKEGDFQRIQATDWTLNDMNPENQILFLNCATAVPNYSVNTITGTIEGNIGAQIRYDYLYY